MPYILTNLTSQSLEVPVLRIWLLPNASYIVDIPPARFRDMANVLEPLVALGQLGIRWDSNEEYYNPAIPEPRRLTFEEAIGFVTPKTVFEAPPLDTAALNLRFGKRKLDLK